MMLDRSAVRGSLMRGTIHVVTVDDYLFLQPLMRPLHERVFPATDRGKRLEASRIPEILQEGRRVLALEPLTLKELGERLGGAFPELDPRAMAQAIRFFMPLVQVTPRGTWGARHQATWALAEDWLGTPIPNDASLEEMVHRYLAAFGPGTVTDIQAWSGLTGIRAVIERIRDDLVVYRNERGQELLDVPNAPLPEDDTPAPVRFLPGFENALLSHKDRTRIVSEQRRKAIGANNGLFLATYLVDGFVKGTWTAEKEKDRVTVTLKPFESHSGETLDALEDEACGLVSLLHPGMPFDLVIHDIVPIP
jgi:hypothetical protein